MNQFGIKLAGSARPIYVLHTSGTLADFTIMLRNGPSITMLDRPCHMGQISIGVAHIVAICGPNKPFTSDGSHNPFPS